ncbi:MAG: T9SS type A sorting domain-containing protein [Ignavibacteriae bacterium]|nr:T9SS type A sorting domain-containing protein [Ignavibacteriota bacterium]
MTARTMDPVDSTCTVGPYISINDCLVDLCMISPACGWLLDGRGRVFRRADLLTAVPGHRSIVPERFILLQNYPNPFNPSTTVRYELPSAGEVDLRVTDVLGREVYRSVEGQTAGWKARSLDLSGHASGIYYCTIRFDGVVQAVKMALVR